MEGDATITKVGKTWKSRFPTSMQKYLYISDQECKIGGGDCDHRYLLRLCSKPEKKRTHGQVTGVIIINGILEMEGDATITKVGKTWKSRFPTSMQKYLYISDQECKIGGWSLHAFQK